MLLISSFFSVPWDVHSGSCGVFLVLLFSKYSSLCFHCFYDGSHIFFFPQVLLSQCHRFRALVLLGRFLDMGPWAVDLVVFVGFAVEILIICFACMCINRTSYQICNEMKFLFLQALSVGIFPYVLKLLQTTTPELRQILVFIWTKILALDKVHI